MIVCSYTKSSQVFKFSAAMCLQYLRNSPSARKWLTVLSCMGLMMSLSAISYFGTIIVYLRSYYNTNKPSTVYLDPLWMLTTYQTIGPLGMAFGSDLASNYFGNCGAVTLFVVVNLLSAFSGFYSIQEPIALLVTYGVVQGFCSGALFNLIWKMCMSCSSRKASGTATGIMCSGIPIGALLISELALLVVNPLNEKRDSELDNVRVFTDPGLISQVPYLFLMNGIFCVVVHLPSLVCLCLVTYSTQKSDRFTNSHLTSDDTTIRSSFSKPCFSRQSLNSQLTAMQSKIIKDLSTLDADKLSTYAHPGSTQLGAGIPLLSPEFQSALEIALEQSNVVGLDPCQVIKTRDFWFLWVLVGVVHASFYIYMNLYKEFAASFIHDDAMLTNIGGIANIFMIFTRPLYGLFVEKKGVKAGLILMTNVSTLLIGLTIVSVYFAQTVTFVIVCVIQINNTSMAPLIFNYAAREAFGAKHYSMNSAALFSAMAMPYLALAFTIPVMVAAWGMKYVFIMATGFSLLSFLLSLMFKTRPRKGRQSGHSVIATESECEAYMMKVLKVYEEQRKIEEEMKAKDSKELEKQPSPETTGTVASKTLSSSNNDGTRTHTSSHS